MKVKIIIIIIIIIITFFFFLFMVFQIMRTELKNQQRFKRMQTKLKYKSMIIELMMVLHNQKNKMRNKVLLSNGFAITLHQLLWANHQTPISFFHFFLLFFLTLFFEELKKNKKISYAIQLTFLVLLMTLWKAMLKTIQ